MKRNSTTFRSQITFKPAAGWAQSPALGTARVAGHVRPIAQKSTAVAVTAAATTTGRQAVQNVVVEGRPFGVEPICALLEVAPSTYYAAKNRAPSARAVSDLVLTPELVTLWEENYRVYGVRKLWEAARRAGMDIARDQTGR